MLDAALVEQQLSTLELLRAVYCADGELVLQPETEEAVSVLQEWLADTSASPPNVPNGLRLLLILKTEDNWNLPASINDPQLEVDITLPLAPSSSQSSRPALRLRQPAWLSRSEYDQLAASLAAPPEDSVGGEEDDLGYVLSTIDNLHAALRTLAPTLSSTSVASSSASNPASANLNSGMSSLVLRTWHHLPSLSTKSKRADLVNYAASHDPPLTGFVLAGKPGLVVLEHPLPSPPALPSPSPASSGAAVAEEVRPTPADIAAASASLDAYWSHIKSHSWASIPPSHKKVSERLREVGPRVFSTMSEVTRSDELGGPGMGGEKGNRQELGVVGRWLEGIGLGGRLERAVGAEWG